MEALDLPVRLRAALRRPQVLDPAVRGETPVFVDLDEASWSWFAADICFALRDFASTPQDRTSTRNPCQSFVAGYREHRPLSDEELASLALFERVGFTNSIALEIGQIHAPDRIYEPLRDFVPVDTAGREA